MFVSTEVLVLKGMRSFLEHRWSRAGGGSPLCLHAAAFAISLVALGWAGPVEAGGAKGDSGLVITQGSLEFMRIHAVGEFQRGHLHLEIGVVDGSSRIRIPGPFPLLVRFRLANMHHDRHMDGSTGESFTRFADRWGTTEAQVVMGPLRLGAGFTLLERQDWTIPGAVAVALWARNGISSKPFSYLEVDGMLFGLPLATASLELGPLALNARYETRSWSPLGYRVNGQALLAWQGVSLDLSGGYTCTGGALSQYAGDVGQPDKAGGISWSMKSADFSVVLGVDFWAPFRHLTPRFPGYVQLQVGTRLRHVVQHSLSDPRGKAFFQETPGASWGFWAGLAVGVLFNKDSI